MRIAFVAPLISSSAVPRLGGAQEIISDLAHGLQRRGHQVTLFARDAFFAPGIPTETMEVTRHYALPTPEGRLADFFMQVNLFLDLFLQLQQRSNEFDVLHVHAQEWASLVYGSIACRIPVIHTLHLPLKGPEAIGAMQVLHRRGYPLTLIAVSHMCARLYTDYIPVDHVIYNGLDISQVPFVERASSDAPLLFAGRIVPEKGVEEAIEIAARSGRKLLIAGSIENRMYYEERIAVKIQQRGDQVSYLGLLKRHELWGVMGQSLGLLFPIRWDEPFGMILIEAMATGTPVIAFRRGAVEEIVRDGATGFVVEANDCTRAAALVDDLSRLQRTQCRTHVATHFSLEKMVEAYEQVYREKVAAGMPLPLTSVRQEERRTEQNEPRKWQPFIAEPLRSRALEAAHLVVERLRDPESVVMLARRAEELSSVPFYWVPTSLISGFTGIALTLSYAARCFPGEGWETSARDYLRLVAEATERSPLMFSEFLVGTSGLALTLATLSDNGRYYQQTRSMLHKQLCEQVLSRQYRREPGAGVAAVDYDVIGGAAGVLAYLLTIEQPDNDILVSIQVLLEYLIWLAGTDENGRERWYIPANRVIRVPGTRHSGIYPNGYFDCGLAHGIPGPLAALASAWLAGYRLSGQREAMAFLVDWILRHQNPDAYGINWPSGIPLESATSEGDWSTLPGTPAAWCYGVPGVARALRLAGTALNDETVCQTAIEAIESSLRRPVMERGIPACTLCHGVAGLLTICLRFAHETSSRLTHEQLPLLVTQILDSFSPDYPLGFRDRGGENADIDHPGWLTGVQGVALALLAASTGVPPDWDHMLLIS